MMPEVTTSNLHTFIPHAPCTYQPVPVTHTTYHGP